MNSNHPLDKPRFSPGMRVILILGIVGLLALIFFITHQGGMKKQQGQGGMKDLKNVPVSVRLGRVSSKTMPVQIRTIGNVETVSTITIKPQIDGQVTGILFKEGAFVKQGQLLFTIDTQPVQASIAQAEAIVSKDQSLVAQARANLLKDQSAVKQAQSTLARDQAQLSYARLQEKRFASLLKDEFISRDQYDQAVTTRRAAEATAATDVSAVQNAQALLEADQSAIASAQATVRADQALVESSRIKLAYGSIRAPFSGRTGSLKIHTGDTVQTGVTPLVVLDRINPIYVGFSVPEQSLKSVKTNANTRKFPVVVKTKEEPPTSLTGVVNFLDNTVDTNTGTIRMKALFQNENRLWPGQFVDVVLNLAEQPNAIVVSSQAIQSGQSGDYVFVAAADNRAEMRPVVVDRVVGDSTVIRSGLRPGEQVVVDGQFQLSPGSLLKVKLPATQ